MTPPRLTDRAALAAHRLRALRRGNGAAQALRDAVRDELHSRLAEVNRTFTAPAVVTGLPALWEGVLPGALVAGDDDVLALGPGAHDLVVHALALHWADDPLGQIIQCARALRPDGLFLAVFPGGRTLAELRAALATAEAGLTGGLSPRVLPMADLRDAGALLQRGGLALPVADLQVQRLAWRDPRGLVADLRGTGEGNALAGRLRRPMPRALWAAALAAWDRLRGPDGLWPATLELVWLTGWAPGPGQPQPLRPGSAAARLAEALGTAETPLPDRAAAAAPRRGEPGV